MPSQTGPLIIADTYERGHVLASDTLAYELGVRVGMTVAQATASAREASIIIDDPRAHATLWERVLLALDAASPLVEDAETGVAFLDMRGIEGDASAWLAAIRSTLSGIALPFHVAVASNKSTARIAAQVANGTIVGAGEERRFLAPRPLHMLPISESLMARLQLLGISTLGALAALAHGPFVRRFGPESAAWHASASGVDPTPLIPRPREIEITRTLTGEGAADREEQVFFALRALVARVAEDVAYAGKRCGFLRLTIECEDGDLHRLTTVLAQPTAQGTTMFDLLRARLEGSVFRSPIIGLRLGAERLEEGGTELSLFAGNDPDPEIIAVTLARLDAALGPGTSLRAYLNDAHLREAQFGYEPFTAHGVAQSIPQTRQPFPTNGTLTYRVLAPRDIAVTVRRSYPASVGTPARVVCDVAGPWRIDEGWWAQHMTTARHHMVGDFYDVALEDGTLLRLMCRENQWSVCGYYD